MWPHTNQLQSDQLHKHSDLHKELLACSFTVIKSCLASSLRAGVCRCTALRKSFAWSAPRTMSHDRLRMPIDVPSPWVSPFHAICGVLHQVDDHWGDICASSGETLVQQDRNCPRCPPRRAPQTLESKCRNPLPTTTYPQHRVMGCVCSQLIWITNRIILQLSNGTISQVIYIFMEYLPQTS